MLSLRMLELHFTQWWEGTLGLFSFVPPLSRDDFPDRDTDVVMLRICCKIMETYGVIYGAFSLEYT